MKNIVSILFMFLLLGVDLVIARMGTAPYNQAGDPVSTADYLGVDIATATLSFSTTNIVIFSGDGSLVGFVASSTPAAGFGDHVLFRGTDSVTGTTDNLNTNEVTRVYLASSTVSNGPAGNIPNQPAMGTSYKFPSPMRFRKGCVGRVVTSVVGGVLNNITYLYNSFTTP